MRTEAKYESDMVPAISNRLNGLNRSDHVDHVRNYFRIRPTLQDTGLSEALYRVGALAANDLRRQEPDVAATEVGCPADSDAIGETSYVPAAGIA